MSEDENTPPAPEMLKRMQQESEQKAWTAICEIMKDLQDVVRKVHLDDDPFQDCEERLSELMETLVTKREKLLSLENSVLLKLAGRIAKNQAISRIRKRQLKRGKGTILREVSSGVSGEGREVNPTAQETIIKSKDIDETIQSLPERLQAAAYAWLVLERPLSVIAKGLGRADRTIRELRRTVRTKLARQDGKGLPSKRPRELPDPPQRSLSEDEMAWRELIRNAKVTRNSRMALAAGIEVIPSVRLVKPISRKTHTEVWEVSVGAEKYAGKIYSWHHDSDMDNSVFESESLRPPNRVPWPYHVTMESDILGSKDCLHQHIIRGCSFGMRDGSQLLLTELADESLWLRNQRQQENASIEERLKRQLSWLDQISEALDWLNGPTEKAIFGITRSVNRIVHCAVSPHNILLFGTTAKLANFHQAVFLDDDFDTINWNGAWEHAAPECYFGCATSYTDQYALASTLYHIITGTLLFKTKGDVLRKKPNLDMFSEPLRRVFARALAVNHRDRFSTCTEFVKRIRLAIGCSKTRSTTCLDQEQIWHEWRLLQKSLLLYPAFKQSFTHYQQVIDRILLDEKLSSLDVLKLSTLRGYLERELVALAASPRASFSRMGIRLRLADWCESVYKFASPSSCVEPVEDESREAPQGAQIFLTAKGPSLSYPHSSAIGISQPTNEPSRRPSCLWRSFTSGKTTTVDGLRALGGIASS